MMSFDEKEVLSFVRTTIVSVTALELLFLLKRRQVGKRDELVRELRSSQLAVETALNSLMHGGLVTSGGKNAYKYEPASPALRRRADEIEQLYAVKPLPVIMALLDSYDEKLRSFASSFKLKE